MTPCPRGHTAKMSGPSHIKKAPEDGAFRGGTLFQSEAVVHAEPQQVRGDAVRGAIEHEGALVQVDVEVFRSGGPISHQRDLKPAARGPADARVSLGEAGRN